MRLNAAVMARPVVPTNHCPRRVEYTGEKKESLGAGVYRVERPARILGPGGGGPEAYLRLRRIRFRKAKQCTRPRVSWSIRPGHGEWEHPPAVSGGVDPVRLRACGGFSARTASEGTILILGLLTCCWALSGRKYCCSTTSNTVFTRWPRSSWSKWSGLSFKSTQTCNYWPRPTPRIC